MAPLVVVAICSYSRRSIYNKVVVLVVNNRRSGSTQNQFNGNSIIIHKDKQNYYRQTNNIT